MQVLRLVFLSCFLLISACGSRNIVKGEIPDPKNGIAFIQVKLEGIEQARIHVFKDGNNFGPHAARIDGWCICRSS